MTPVNAHQAAIMIADGEIPMVRFSRTYLLRDLLRMQGYFDHDKVCRKPFQFVVDHGTHIALHTCVYGETQPIITTQKPKPTEANPHATREK